MLNQATIKALASISDDDHHNISDHLFDRLSVQLSACLSVHPSICPSVSRQSFRLSACLSVHLSNWRAICLFVLLSVCLSICPCLSICLSFHPSICLPFHPSSVFCLSVHPSIRYLSIHLYVLLSCSLSIRLYIHLAQPLLNSALVLSTTKFIWVRQHLDSLCDVVNLLTYWKHCATHCSTCTASHGRNTHNINSTLGTFSPPTCYARLPQWPGLY